MMTDIKFIGDTQLERDIAPVGEVLRIMKSETVRKISSAISKIDKQIEDKVSSLPVQGFAGLPPTSMPFDRTQTLPTNVRKILVGQLRRYSNWRYPGMTILNHDTDFTKHLAQCEPLYLVSNEQLYINQAMENYTDVYKTRVRPYLVHGDIDFHKLPHGQFGFIFCWNTFEHMQASSIETYMLWFSHLLRPGGTLLMSYNDADTVMGAQKVDWGGSDFTTRRSLAFAAEKVGLNLHKAMTFSTDSGEISWLELQKYGELETIKVHPTMGIVNRIE